MRPATETSDHWAGFVAAEATFSASGGRFAFTIGLGATDAASCDAIRTVLGVGRVSWYPRRKSHYDDEVRLTVRRQRHLVEVVVPWLDVHLPPSYKRQQYLVWRGALLAHWERQDRRRG